MEKINIEGKEYRVYKKVKEYILSLEEMLIIEKKQKEQISQDFSLALSGIQANLSDLERSSKNFLKNDFFKIERE